VFADAPEDLEADAVMPKLRNLVTQMSLLYRARHFNHYTFLLTVSDVLPGEGVEHHQSSDDGSAADFLTTRTSWWMMPICSRRVQPFVDGKYRGRPIWRRRICACR